MQDQDKYLAAYATIKDSDDLREMFSKDLFGVTHDGNTTVTVMRYIQGDAVKPKNDIDISKYWKLFKKLCIEVLIPLATEDVIHQDLRPGYDCTYNILIETALEGQTMKIIDYESLCRVTSYAQLGPRYPFGPVTIESVASGKTFYACFIVFQQCIGMAYAWIEQINAKQFDFGDALVWWLDIVSVEMNSTKKNDIATIALKWWENQMKDGIENAFNRLFGEIEKQVKALNNRKREAERTLSQEESREQKKRFVFPNILWSRRLRRRK